MSSKELDRAAIIKLIMERRLSQVQAAQQLQLSSRQVRRLCNAYRHNGVQALCSKKRRQPSNRKLSSELQAQCIELIKKDYYDYGPTLAAEKLAEYNDLTISKETARKWMIQAGIWKPKRSHKASIHQPRYRRECYGELIQIDGSEHAWFEDRGPKCTLLVFIDDATSTIQKLLFAEQETTFSYLEILEDYVKTYGIPRAIYSDKHGVFSVNIKEAKSGTGFTQFGRALDQLGVEAIFAHSAPAKGRVERCNGTLQDRLVKELRYRNISDMAAANAFLESFRLDFNRRFAKVPKDIVNIHRSLAQEELEQLQSLFTLQTPRKVSRNLMVRYHTKLYKLKLPDKGHRLRQAGVVVCEDRSGKITILYQQQALAFEVYKERLHESEILDRKGVEAFLNRLPAPRNIPFQGAQAAG